MLTRALGILSLTLVLACPLRASASVVDEYADAAFGDTGAAWRMTSFKQLGSYVVVTIMPDRDVGIVVAELTIRPDGELHGVRVQYGSPRVAGRAVVRVR